MSRAAEQHPASFRDPSGFIFVRDGEILRQVNEAYRGDWDHLASCGLLEKLWSQGLLVKTERVDLGLAAVQGAIAVLKPERLPFISHPTEWSFGMLKEAALLTLKIQETALDHGMSLKDASAYNIQFHRGRPLFIDNLSFERHEKSAPWVAYGQFCRHFLAPLALMAHVDVRLQALLGDHLDGLPLDLASRLLPGKTKFNAGLMMHLHLHAKAESSGKGGSEGAEQKGGFSEAAMRGLIASLEKAVSGLEWKPAGTEWADYYNDTNYTADAAEHKHQILKSWITEAATACSSCWDLGANDGRYSRIAAEAGLWTLAADIDPAAVEQAWLYVRKSRLASLHPLLLDLRNPSPGRGWMNRERSSLLERGPADLVLALALIHHLAIGNNVPLPNVLELFCQLGREVIVEWVPKDDSQIQRMMRARKDIFAGFTEGAFEASLPTGIRIKRKEPIKESGRILYWLART